MIDLCTRFIMDYQATLVETRNDLLLIAMYEMVEKANEILRKSEIPIKVRYESQRTYTF